MRDVVALLLMVLFTVFTLVCMVSAVYYGVVALLVIVVDNPNLSLWQKILAGWGWVVLFLGGMASGLLKGIQSKGE